MATTLREYLDKNGVLSVFGQMKTWVQNHVKITSATGKDTITAGNNSVDIYDWAQASTKPSYTQDEIGEGTTNKPFTATEKNKLAGIAAGAEVNVNADWDAVSGDAQILNKPTIPSKTSDLNNDSGFITTSDIPPGAAASTTTPKMDGTAAVGTELAFARGDHQHPTDTSRAPLASPALTGTPTAPTAAAGTNSTQIATTAFVKAAVDAAKVGAATFQGTVNAATDISGLTNYKSGYYWIVATAGEYAGETCEVGDMIFCKSDYASSYKASDFSVVQSNLNVSRIDETWIVANCV